MGKLWKQFVSGIVVTNPIYVLVLGLCPFLATSVTVDNGIAMTGAFAFCVTGSNLVISAVRKIVPNIVRIPAFIVIIATIVTVTNLVFHAYLPALYKSLGIFLPLIVVNCIIMGRAEAYASKNPVMLSIADSLGASVGFGVVMVTVSIIRELLGTGSLTLFGFHLFTLPVLGDAPMALFILSPGGFFIIALSMALLRWRGVIK